MLFPTWRDRIIAVWSQRLSEERVRAVTAESLAANLATKLENAMQARNLAESDLYAAQLKAERLEQRIADITASKEAWAEQRAESIRERHALKVELRATRQALGDRDRTERQHRQQLVADALAEANVISHEQYEREMAAAQKAAEVAHRRADSWEREAAIRGEERDGWRNRAKDAERRLAELEGKPRTGARGFLASIASEIEQQHLEARRQAKIEWDEAGELRPYFQVAFLGGGKLCTLPLKGWWCTLDLGHPGPCPARETSEPVA